MDKKKLKKLALKKTRVTDLTNEKMSRIQGGTTPGTGWACFFQIGDMMEANSDGPYMMDCLDLTEEPSEPVGDSNVVLYGGCLITE